VVHEGWVDMVVVDKEMSMKIIPSITQMDKPTPEVVAVVEQVLNTQVHQVVDLVLLSSIILYNNIIFI
jgi:hypothetical protein